MNDKLKIVYRPLKELTPYARNARTHSGEQVAQLVASIEEFGWTNPVLIDENGEIIAGHGRVLAAEAIGIVSVPTIKLNGLTEEQKRTYRLIDNLDDVLSAMLDYYISIPATTIAMAQGGDFLGDSNNAAWLKRKAMNSFICSTDRPFAFMGRINEDVSTYATLGRRGALFMTVGAVQLLQQQTQKSRGGMTELYLASGTYVKSFYSVMHAPSCVKISLMGSTHKRIHHQVSWNNAAVKILREKYKKSAPEKIGGGK